MHLLLRDQLLLWLQTAGLVLLSVRIWWTGLYRTYPSFFLYLLAALLQSAVLAAVPYASSAYRYAWLATEGLIACFYALVVLELYSVVLRDLTGIARLSRRYIQGALFLAIVVSVLLLALEKSSTYLVPAFFKFERSIVSSLVIFVLLVTAFLAYYPIQLTRNVILYSGAYTFYFLAKATLLFLVNRTLRVPPLTTSLLIAISTMCLWFWLFTLNRQGEAKRIVVGHRWNPEHEAAILSRLKAINESLIRAGKR